jgi:hypothetical protein
MDIQELISRGRFIFSGAPKRFEVFKLVNGKRSAKEIARKSGRGLSPTLADLQKAKDMGLIRPREDRNGRIVKKENSLVYEKDPLVRHISISYFQDSVKSQKEFVKQKMIAKKPKVGRLKALRVPSENEILDICKSGEDQLYEFKGPGTEIKRLTKEIAAFLNTKMGGLIFYGVEDDGAIVGSDMRRQGMDQSLQNSIKNTISPSAIVEIKTKDVVGHTVLVIVIPPWNGKDVYQYSGRIYIRKGTNVFIAKPEEVRKLHDGKYVI